MMRFCSNFRFKNVNKVRFSHTEVLSRNMEYERTYPNDVKGLSVVKKNFSIKFSDSVLCAIFIWLFGGLRSGIITHELHCLSINWSKYCKCIKYFHCVISSLWFEKGVNSTLYLLLQFYHLCNNSRIYSGGNHPCTWSNTWNCTIDSISESENSLTPPSSEQDAKKSLSLNTRELIYDARRRKTKQITTMIDWN